MSNKHQTNVVKVEVTDEEYQADLVQGLEEDEVLQPGLHTFRRGAFLARHSLTPEQRTTPAKVCISIELDQDLLDFVVERAAKSNDASYETQINEILRAVMEEESKTDSKALSPEAEDLLANVHFIDAVAKRVAAHQRSPLQPTPTTNPLA